MLQTDSVDKKIYEFIMNDIDKSNKNFSVLTNPQISKELEISPNTVRDKVARLAKNGYLLNLINHWDENNKFYNRKMFKGKIPG